MPTPPLRQSAPELTDCANPPPPPPASGPPAAPCTADNTSGCPLEENCLPDAGCTETPIIPGTPCQVAYSFTLPEAGQFVYLPDGTRVWVPASTSGVSAGSASGGGSSAASSGCSPNDSSCAYCAAHPGSSACTGTSEEAGANGGTSSSAGSSGGSAGGSGGSTGGCSPYDSSCAYCAAHPSSSVCPPPLSASAALDRLACAPNSDVSDICAGAGGVNYPSGPSGAPEPPVAGQDTQAGLPTTGGDDPSGGTPTGGLPTISGGSGGVATALGGYELPGPGNLQAQVVSNNGTGLRLIGTNFPGLAQNVTEVRLQGPTNLYPNGYAVYYSGNQAVNPFTGQTIADNDPFRHIPLFGPVPGPPFGAVPVFP